MGKWGLKPPLVTHEGCSPLLGYQGFSQEGQDPPRGASKTK